MQTKSLRIKSYKSWAISDTAGADAIARMKTLKLYRTLKAEGCNSATCFEAIGWSKATYYRWLKRYQEQGMAGLERLSCRPARTRAVQWNKQQEQQVQHLRQRHRLSAKSGKC